MAADLLREWDRRSGELWQVCPREMVGRLAHPLGGRSGARAGVIGRL
jgi:glutamate synthase (NADPH/NADH) large chain